MRFSLRVENDQADARQDGRSRLARPNSQARAGTGKYLFSLISWPRGDWQPVDIYTAVQGWDNYRYMHVVQEMNRVQQSSVDTI